MSAVLAAQGLCKSFGAVTAAADITLSFDADNVVSLIGANGAGKTTFLNMVTGYLKPDSGRILLDGRDITGLTPAPDHKTRRLAFVPNSAAFPDTQRARQPAARREYCRGR